MSSENIATGARTRYEEKYATRQAVTKENMEIEPAITVRCRRLQPSAMEAAMKATAGVPMRARMQNASDPLMPIAVQAKKMRQLANVTARSC